MPISPILFNQTYEFDSGNQSKTIYWFFYSNSYERYYGVKVLNETIDYTYYQGGESRGLKK
jgi:hypothetical protein